jgi:hypothetical protein
MSTMTQQLHTLFLLNEFPTMDSTTPAAFVEAKLQYLSKDGAAQATYNASEAGTPDAAKHEGEYEYHPMKIHNGRSHHNKPSWSIDREGFQLLPHESSVQDFYNDEEIERVYNAEVTSLLQTATGAKQIYIFDHTRRSSESNIRTARQSREPSLVIHNDYTEKSAHTRLQDFLGEEEAKRVQQGRFAIVNVWRSIHGTIENWPLTFCDSTTLAPQDVIPVKRMAKNRIGEIQMASFNPNHNWYYFPQMTPGEVVLIKTYDSATTTGINKCTLHTSFADPTAPSDTNPRQSMETRAFVFY